MPMFDRLTDRAVRILIGADAEAKARGQDFTGVEHLLLATLKDSQAPATIALEVVGLETELVAAAVAAQIGTPGNHMTSAPARPDGYSPESQRVLELAVHEADILGDNYLSDVHLLLAILRDGGSTAAQVLTQHGVTLSAVRSQFVTGAQTPVVSMAPSALQALIQSDRESRNAAYTAATENGRSGSVFSRFTDGARRVVVLAQQEAKARGHDYIGTEHLLLGLVREGKGPGAKALVELGISLPRVYELVDEIVGQSDADSPERIHFTLRAKTVLESALRDATTCGQDYVGTEHLLLGLIREGEGVAAQVLVKLGATFERTRNVALLEIGQVSTDAPTVLASPSQTRNKPRRLWPLPRKLRSLIQGQIASGRAVRLERKGEIEAAIAEYQWAIELSQHIPSGRLIVRGYLADLYQQENRPLEAIPIWRAIADEARAVRRYSVGTSGMLGRDVRLEALKEIADAYEGASDYEAELAARVDQANAALDAADLDSRFEALLKAATAATKLRRLSEAIARYEEVLREADERANQRARCLALLPLAHLRFQFGDVDEAWNLLADAMALRAHVREAGLIAEAYWLMAFFRTRLGDIAAAADSLQSAIQLIESDPVESARVGRYRGELEMLPGPFADAYWTAPR
jgi:tetratricopeptide (TPR) repeat protein